MFEIKSRFTNKIIFRSEIATTIGEAAKEAIRAGAYLAGAYLADAYQAAEAK
jgi:hypothetical protein